MAQDSIYYWVPSNLTLYVCLLFFFFLFLGPCSLGHLRGPTRCQGRDCSYELQTHPTTSPDRYDNQCFLNHHLSCKTKNSLSRACDPDSYSSQTMFSSTFFDIFCQSCQNITVQLPFSAAKSLCCIYGGLLFFPIVNPLFELAR